MLVLCTKLFVSVGLCWFCQGSSLFLFVYVDLVNKALCFCLFMLVLQTKLFVSVCLCSFGKRSSLFLFVYVKQSKKRSGLCFFLRFFQPNHTDSRGKLAPQVVVFFSNLFG